MIRQIILLFVGFSALHVATLNGNKQLIGTILDMGADIDEQVGLNPLLHVLQLVVFQNRPLPN